MHFPCQAAATTPRAGAYPFLSWKPRHPPSSSARQQSAGDAAASCGRPKTHNLLRLMGFPVPVFGRCGFTLLKFGFRNTSLYSFIVFNYTESHLPTSKLFAGVLGEVWSDIHRSSIRFVNFSLIVCTENVRISTYKIQLPNLLHSFGCHSDGGISSWGSTEAQLNRETSRETQ